MIPTARRGFLFREFHSRLLTLKSFGLSAPQKVNYSLKEKIFNHYYLLVFICKFTHFKPAKFFYINQAAYFTDTLRKSL